MAILIEQTYWSIIFFKKYSSLIRSLLLLDYIYITSKKNFPDRPKVVFACGPLARLPRRVYENLIFQCRWSVCNRVFQRESWFSTAKQNPPKNCSCRHQIWAGPSVHHRAPPVAAAAVLLLPPTGSSRRRSLRWLSAKIDFHVWVC